MSLPKIESTIKITQCINLTGIPPLAPSNNTSEAVNSYISPRSPDSSAKSSARNGGFSRKTITSSTLSMQSIGNTTVEDISEYSSEESEKVPSCYQADIATSGRADEEDYGLTDMERIEFIGRSFPKIFHGTKAVFINCNDEKKINERISNHSSMLHGVHTDMPFRKVTTNPDFQAPSINTAFQKLPALRRIKTLSLMHSSINRPRSPTDDINREVNARSLLKKSFNHLSRTGLSESMSNIEDIDNSVKCSKNVDQLDRPIFF